jgi:hypothetical protein
MRQSLREWVCGLVLAILAAPAMAGEAEIVEATMQRASDGTYAVSVTVRHADEGWQHYADRWDVLEPDGTLLGSRILAHPHVDEQPFTRSLTGVAIPDHVAEIVVRVHDSVHGLGSGELRLEVPR